MAWLIVGYSFYRLASFVNRNIVHSNSHFGGGDGEEEGRERAKKDWKLRG
jgi:hypothetical protein